MITIQLERFGGKADGSTDNTGPFKAALEYLRDEGGGILNIGPGEWRTGPIEIYSDTSLRLQRGAMISFIPEPERHKPVYTRWEGIECYAMIPCVYASGQKNIRIFGEGRIDGNGRVWWEKYRFKRASGQKEPMDSVEKRFAELNPGYRDQTGGGGGREIQFLRPDLIQFHRCEHIEIRGIAITNSPFWTVHPLYCDGLLFDSLAIQNPHDSPNTDGIDVDSCKRVEISRCTIDVGDDGIALKSGSGLDGLRVNKPTAYVKIWDCEVKRGHGGVVIGSETAGGIHDVEVENCRFSGTDRGIRLKTRRGRGGEIHHLIFKDLIMEDNLCPLSINEFYHCGARMEDGFFANKPMEVNETTPNIHHIAISGIHAIGCRASAGFIVGLPERPILFLTIKDSVFEIDDKDRVHPRESDMYLGLPDIEKRGIRCINVRGIRLSEVTVRGTDEPFVMDR